MVHSIKKKVNSYLPIRKLLYGLCVCYVVNKCQKPPSIDHLQRTLHKKVHIA
jgi:hypothetical protein